jgi:hypothetical protein
MKLNDMNKLITLLGATESEISTYFSLSSKERTEIHEGSDWYFIELENGLELSFERPAQALRKISINVAPLAEEEITYSGELPYGITELGSMQRIRAHWGEPINHEPPLKLWGLADTGGGDIYNIDAHPDKKLIIGYMADLKIQSVHVELR